MGGLTIMAKGVAKKKKRNMMEIFVFIIDIKFGVVNTANNIQFRPTVKAATKYHDVVNAKKLLNQQMDRSCWVK